jgi:hypothetical protein
MSSGKRKPSPILSDLLGSGKKPWMPQPPQGALRDAEPPPTAVAAAPAAPAEGVASSASLPERVRAIVKAAQQSPKTIEPSSRENKELAPDEVPPPPITGKPSSHETTLPSSRDTVDPKKPSRLDAGESSMRTSLETVKPSTNLDRGPEEEVATPVFRGPVEVRQPSNRDDPALLERGVRRLSSYMLPLDLKANLSIWKAELIARGMKMTEGRIIDALVEAADLDDLAAALRARIGAPTSTDVIKASMYLAPSVKRQIAIWKAELRRRKIDATEIAIVILLIEHTSIATLLRLFDPPQTIKL